MNSTFKLPKPIWKLRHYSLGVNIIYNLGQTVSSFNDNIVTLIPSFGSPTITIGETKATRPRIAANNDPMYRAQLKPMLSSMSCKIDE